MFYCFNLKKHKKIIKILFILTIIMFVLSIGLKTFVFKKDYKNLVEKYSAEYNLDENLVYSVIFTESKFIENAISNRGAKGLMQIMDYTGQWISEMINLDGFQPNNLYNPEINIEMGCWYLNYLFNVFENEDEVIAAYNAGNGNVSKWLKDSNYSLDGINLNKIPFEETEKYLQKVKYTKIIYEILY